MSSMSGWSSLKRPSRGTSQRDAIAGSTETLSVRTLPWAAASRVASRHIVEEGGQAVAEAPAGIGQDNTAAGAGKELGAEPFLQFADMAADRGMGDEQLLGRIGEALMAGGGLEGPEGIQGRQAPGHRVSCKFSLQVA